MAVWSSLGWVCLRSWSARLPHTPSFPVFRSGSTTGEIPGQIRLARVSNRSRPNTRYRAGDCWAAGLGRGSPWLIPEVQTDFVVAAVAEELGFLGIVVVVALFLLLAGRGLKIAAESKSPFLKLLAVGLTASLVIQGIVILGGVFRMLPLTGVTLPFVSYGGSSILGLDGGGWVASSDQRDQWCRPDRPMTACPRRDSCKGRSR